MSDLELNKTLFDQDTPVAKARESLKQEYGDQWLEKFEDWATHPDSLPLATAFHAAHAARMHLQRGFMETRTSYNVEVPAQFPQTEPAQVTQAIRDLHAAAQSESTDQVARLFNKEKQAISEALLQVEHLNPSFLPINSRDRSGIRCLTALHSETLGAEMTTYGTYLQQHRRLVSVPDVDRRAEKIFEDSLTPGAVRSSLSTQARLTYDWASQKVSNLRPLAALLQRARARVNTDVARIVRSLRPAGHPNEPLPV